MYGLWSTAHSIGEGLTFLLIGGVVAAFGWRYGFFAPTLICLGAAAFTSLPALAEGRTPEVRLIDAQIQIANESPAKNVQVLLAKQARTASRHPGTIGKRQDLP